MDTLDQALENFLFEEEETEIVEYDLDQYGEGEWEKPHIVKYDSKMTTADWDVLARRQMESYFETREYFCGGPVPPNLVMTERNVEFVRDVVRARVEGFYDVIDSYYSVMDRCSPLRNEPFDRERPCLPAQLLRKLHEMESLRVAKEFIPALLMLELKFCQGYGVEDDEIDRLIGLAGAAVV